MSESKLVESISIDEEKGWLKIKKEGRQEEEIMYCPLGYYQSDFLEHRNKCNIYCAALHYRETNVQKFVYCNQYFDFYCKKEQQRDHRPKKAKTKYKYDVANYSFSSSDPTGILIQKLQNLCS